MQTYYKENTVTTRNIYESNSCDYCNEQMTGTVRANSRYHAECYLKALSDRETIREMTKIRARDWRLYG